MPQEEDEDEEPLNLGVYQKSSILPILLSHAFVNQDKVEQDDNSAKSTFFRFTFFLIDGSKKKDRLFEMISYNSQVLNRGSMDLPV